MKSLAWKRAEILAQWTKRHLLNKAEESEGANHASQ